eukprot:CAMPEP_0114297966 /NCGR_PEP_ID=MMETSP0059-20121206/12155_1 /TAXON_ID=36894 /ORGANISM="Pyramimonas parkeae, Strain CCMP726" /LENGTH=669 /DNA_ID=CAMNT_0001420273 /DNA_START=65 /DNA_END=2071 /DNA_ORIENTATION=+
MKINIVVEITPEEFPLATELLATIRALTDHVRVVSPESALPAPKASSAVQCPPAAASSEGASSARPVPTAPAPAGVVAAAEETRALELCIASLQSTPRDAVLVEIDRWVPIFGDPPRGDMSQRYEALAEALTKVVYEKDGVPAEMFLDIIPALPEAVKKVVNINISKFTFDHLFGKNHRPLDCSREPFMRHAEVSASLVQLQVLKLSLAVKIIAQHFVKPKYRCAAVTMLSRTVEKAATLIQSAEPVMIAQLRSLVDTFEPVFEHDKGNILECINQRLPDAHLGLHQNQLQQPELRGPPQQSQQPQPLQQIVHQQQPPPQQSQPQPQQQVVHQQQPPPQQSQPPSTAQSGGGSHPPGSRMLAFTKSMIGHTNTVFTMAYDSLADNLYTSGKDGQLIAWNVDGTVKETHRAAANQYTSFYAMDVDVESRSLYACALGKKLPNVFHHRLQTDPQAMSCGAWAFSECLSWRDRKPPAMLSAIKALAHGGSRCFIMSESLKPSVDAPSYVAVYDVSSTSFSDLTPVSLHHGHTQLISCLSAVPGQPSAFLSGAQDSTIRLWDRRAASQCSVFGGDVSHQASVMGLDANSSNTVLSTGQDKSVARWDMRSLHSPVSKIQLDDSVHSKVACAGNRAYAGVTTLRGLYCLDLSTPQLSLGEVQMKPMNSRYGEIKW